MYTQTENGCIFERCIAKPIAKRRIRWGRKSYAGEDGRIVVQNESAIEEGGGICPY